MSPAVVTHMVTLLVVKNELVSTKQKLTLTVADFHDLISQLQSQLKLSPDRAIEVVKSGSETVAMSLDDLGAKAKVEVSVVGAVGEAAAVEPGPNPEPELELEPELEAKS